MVISSRTPKGDLTYARFVVPPSRSSHQIRRVMHPVRIAVICSGSPGTTPVTS